MTGNLQVLVGFVLFFDCYVLVTAKFNFITFQPPIRRWRLVVIIISILLFSLFTSNSNSSRKIVVGFHQLSPCEVQIRKLVEETPFNPLQKILIHYGVVSTNFLSPVFHSLWSILENQSVWYILSLSTLGCISW